MSRPTVNVVVPFRGDDAAFEDLERRLKGLRLAAGDTLTVVDNSPSEQRAGTLHAAEISTPAYARNRGAAEGDAPWLVFIDADVTPAPDLLDRYFEPAPAERTALLAGGIEDEPVPPGGPAAARYVYLRGFMSQEDTLQAGRWGFPKTANAAVRRAALDEVGGFAERVRAAEDADLTFRLKAAGWEMERRERAVVVHHSRMTVSGFVRQKLTHGAGGAWLERRYPGASPPRRLPGMLWWGARHATKGVTAAVRDRDRDRALWAVLEPVELITHELGRWLPNERAEGAARSRRRA